jgi:nucleoid DNA-binding protein
MGAKPLSKTKIVSHIAEKVGTPKKTAALFFDELYKLAVKEGKSGAGKFAIPGLGRTVKVHRKTRAGNREAILPKRRKRNSRSDKALSTLAKVYGF